jgi:cobalt/nickel transport system ATP-binding protein
MKVIEIRGLTYTYPDGKKALDNIDLDVFQGETLGIIGPNGAGKTTLILHFNGILMNENSMIKIFDIPLNNKTKKEIRKKVGIVFQNPDDQLFMPTVFEDIAFGLLNLGLPQNDIRKKVKYILESIGLSGYGERASHHLSFGEKKKVALASVLVMEPEILVLDEPTSELDPASKRELIEIIRSLKITKIIASHDINMIKKLCERVIILNNGRKVIEGKIQILNDESLLFKNRLM